MSLSRPWPRLVGLLLAAFVLAGCSRSSPPLEGTPPGPYALTLALKPPAPMPGQPARLTLQVTRSQDGAPVGDLQRIHERYLHTFIVARDFSSFAHIHHEDFAPLGDADLAAGRFQFDYRFPQAGVYRVVSEFTHRDRSWMKQFDLPVGQPGVTPSIVLDLAREQHVGEFAARLAVSPAQPVAGQEAELVFELNRNGQPVRDLQLLLGAETHVALWKLDGTQFGHTHSYTPRMAAMMARMAGHRMSPEHSAAMMLQMMSLPAERVYPGPQVPVRHTFPEAGDYVLFAQFAPGGQALHFRFMLRVAEAGTGEPPVLQSIVQPLVERAAE